MINFGKGAKIGMIIGVIGGLIGLAAGIFAPLAAGDTTGAIFGVVFGLIFIAIFGGVFVGIFKPIMEQKKLLKEGTPVKGEILEISDTGVTLNDSPQIKLKIRVIPTVGSPYETTMKTFVSRINPNVYMPGQTVDLKVSKKDKMKIVIVPAGYKSSNSVSQDSTYVKELEEKLKAAQEVSNELLLKGILAKAIILKSNSFGVNVNGNNPAVELELQVIPDDKPAFKSTSMGVISEGSISKYQPGKEVYVKYDPMNTSTVAIERAV
jgi:hypothetical protein